MEQQNATEPKRSADLTANVVAAFEAYANQ